MKDTQDCKNFLGHFFNLNKQFFADFYNIDLTAKTFKNTGAIVDNQTLQLFTYTSAFPNSWKRTFKSISKLFKEGKHHLEMSYSIGFTIQKDRF